MKRTVLFSLLVIVILLLSACSTAPVEEDSVAPSEVVTATSDEISFSQDIMPVLEKFATRAHGNSGGVNLENYENVMKVVVAGSPEESMLYKALTGDGMPVMPPSGKLDDATIQLFYDWIAQGAKNN